MTYDKFRVRSPVKSFRDLEVYQQATQLSAAIFGLKPPGKFKGVKDAVCEIEKLKEMSKNVPRLIVESYGDKFTSFELSAKKLEMASQTINLIVAKLDFLSALIDDEKWRSQLSEILKKYQRVRMRIINLKKAWNRVFGK
ncbi:MAG: hypothetical protein ABIJ85_04415 [bacterium]|nr:hypothetical protein [Patescibacteria group bacterium]